MYEEKTEKSSMVISIAYILVRHQIFTMYKTFNVQHGFFLKYIFDINKFVKKVIQVWKTYTNNVFL